MMGYMFCLGTCIRCRTIFSFNPERVPSIVIDGKREPLCKACVEWANPKLKELGMHEIVILPGAYDATEVT
jgi:hypothetical protein